MMKINQRLCEIKMLIPVLTFILFAKQILISQCAPKLGPVLFDPLTDISDPMVELPPELPPPIAAVMLRSENKPEGEPGRPCQGYNFDENNCKLVNNRILCGYNKNIGEIENKEIVVDIGNGCHLKGDRIECGYKTGPFEGIRRPSLQANGKEAMRYSQARTPIDKIMMKLKAVSITGTPTEKNAKITKLRAVLSLSEVTSYNTVSKEDSDETEISETTKGVSETEIEKDLNLTMPTTIFLSNDSSLPTVTPTTITNTTTTTIPSNDSGSFLDVSEDIITTKSDENIDSEKSIEKGKTNNESTLSKSEYNTQTSSRNKETTVNKIRIKRRNSSQNKPRQALCIEKKDRIVCYDDHFLPKKCG